MGHIDAGIELRLRISDIKRWDAGTNGWATLDGGKSATVGAAPSDAIVLFDGRSLDAWKNANTGAAAGWKIKGATTYSGAPSYRPHAEMPLRLQDHRHPVRYRNIWVRRI